MARDAAPTPSTNSALLRALEPFRDVAALVRGVADALGLSDLGDVARGDPEVLGFFLIPGDQIFEAYLCCRRTFRIFQLSGEGNSLSLTFSRDRIRRLAEERDANGTDVLTIEVEADATSFAGDMTLGQALDENREPIPGLKAATIYLGYRPVVYTLRGGDPKCIGDVAGMARALRRMLES